METSSNTGYDTGRHHLRVERISAKDGPAAYQLVGGVMAYQGFDG